MTICRLLLALFACLFFAVPASAAPDWNVTVVRTQDGILIGNPAAKVKLVEYASTTCPHCAHFAAEGWPALRAGPIRSGRLSLELRFYPLNGVDLPAEMLLRCNPPRAAMRITEDMFANQAKVFAATITEEDGARIGKLPPERVSPEIARMMALDKYFIGRGMSPKAVSACLTDMKRRDAIVDTRKRADAIGIEGTPSFLIDGKLQAGTFNWAALQPALQAALK